MSNAREIAMKVIYDVEFNGAYSNMALKKALKTDMPKQDKAFVSNLVYGVTDRKLTLDYVIGKFSKIKLKKISKYILIILRMGIYQIMFMDKVPISAAVNESVKLARRYGHGASAGFVNGLLRNVSKTEIEYPSDKTEYFLSNIRSRCGFVKSGLMNSDMILPKN
ncbi:MAG: transcription antitermination factor NusB [Hominilimicola sp.]